MIYGATGQTGFDAIAQVLAGGHSVHGNLLGDPLLLTGIAPGRRRLRLQGLGRAVPPVDPGRL